MFVSEVMTESAVVVHPETTISDAIHLMLDKKISGLPVLDPAGNLVGVLTEGDLLRRSELGTERHRTGWLSALQSQSSRAQEYVASHARQVINVMTTAVISVTPKTPLEEAVALMEKHHVKRLPVLRQGRLVGIVSRANLLQALAAHLDAESTASDMEISRRLQEELARQAWTPLETIRFDVSGGVVVFDGAISDERFRVALRVLAQNILGVHAVHDHMAFVEPMSGVVIGAPNEG